MRLVGLTTASGRSVGRSYEVVCGAIGVAI